MDYINPRLLCQHVGKCAQLTSLTVPVLPCIYIWCKIRSHLLGAKVNWAEHCNSNTIRFSDSYILLLDY